MARKCQNFPTINKSSNLHKILFLTSKHLLKCPYKGLKYLEDLLWQYSSNLLNIFNVNMKLNVDVILRISHCN